MRGEVSIRETIGDTPTLANLIQSDKFRITRGQLRIKMHHATAVVLLKGLKIDDHVDWRSSIKLNDTPLLIKKEFYARLDALMVMMIAFIITLGEIM